QGPMRCKVTRTTFILWSPSNPIGEACPYFQSIYCILPQNAPEVNSGYPISCPKSLKGRRIGLKTTGCRLGYTDGISCPKETKRAMLNAEQKAFYDENGYVVVRGMFTPEECAAYRAECHALAERLQKIRNINATWGSAKELDGAADTVVLHCHDVQFQSAAFA